MSVRRLLSSVVVVVVLGAGLVGCGQDEPDAEARPKLPDPTSQAPSPTPSATPEQETPEEFIRRWQDEADLMVESGNSDVFRALSPGCQACGQYADRIESAYASGATVRFQGSTVERIVLKAAAPPTLLVRVASAPLTITFPSGKAEEYPSSTQQYRMTLKRTKRGWRMSHYSVL